MEENTSGGYDSTKSKIENEANEATNDLKEGWNDVTNNGENKKMIAGILAIVLGVFGIHKFILGYTQEGILTIVFSVITCGIAGQIIGLIEGIIYLTKTDEEFYQTYQVGKKGWF